MSREEKLSALGLQLPEVAMPVGAYMPGLISGQYIYTSGQLSSQNGVIMTGKLGGDRTTDEGVEAARQAAINCLAVAKAVAGSLERIVRVVKVTCFVNSTADFAEQPKVANGASFLLQDVFGDAGVHVRSAVGVSNLPMNACCEVEMVFEID